MGKLRGMKKYKWYQMPTFARWKKKRFYKPKIFILAEKFPRVFIRHKVKVLLYTVSLICFLSLVSINIDTFFMNDDIETNYCNDFEYNNLPPTCKRLADEINQYNTSPSPVYWKDIYKEYILDYENQNSYSGIKVSWEKIKREELEKMMVREIMFGCDITGILQVYYGSSTPGTYKYWDCKEYHLGEMKVALDRIYGTEEIINNTETPEFENFFHDDDEAIY
jgi:hypothetical protein